MCHEEIHRRPRADLADRDPVAHRDCKRSPGVAVEPGVRKQRLLTISAANERFCSRLKTWHSLGGQLAPASRPPARRAINRAAGAILLAAMSAVGLIHGAVGRANERKSGQSKARQIKSR